MVQAETVLVDLVPVAIRKPTDKIRSDNAWIVRIHVAGLGFSAQWSSRGACCPTELSTTNR